MSIWKRLCRRRRVRWHSLSWQQLEQLDNRPFPKLLCTRLPLQRVVKGRLTPVVSDGVVYLWAPFRDAVVYAHQQFDHVEQVLGSCQVQRGLTVNVCSVHVRCRFPLADHERHYLSGVVGRCVVQCSRTTRVLHIDRRARVQELLDRLDFLVAPNCRNMQRRTAVPVRRIRVHRSTAGHAPEPTRLIDTGHPPLFFVCGRAVEKASALFDPRRTSHRAPAGAVHAFLSRGR